MRTDDFDYNLPAELIAQAPAEPRDSCRLLVLHRGEPLSTTGEAVPLESGGSVEHRHFYDIIDYIEPGDVLVINRRASCRRASSAARPARAAWPRRSCSSAARTSTRSGACGSASSTRVAASSPVR